ncbi:Uu.00g007190.m01.CDS01 [Anthostomella pinea]|uniref:Uu.00g007190.m01.CDS01 n=1 Tax=Anthostomella pinea TaxID=933095 RepID=A0AAI8VXV1_9PEZI|nr:Uu.00g007190.m01.CDS01 [Anthostomella pinea]
MATTKAMDAAAAEIQPPLTVIDVKTSEALESLLETISGLPTKLPSLYLDYQGPADGNVITLCLFIPPNVIYRVLLGTRRSVDPSASNAMGVSLKTILESDYIPKVTFDVRSPSSVMFRHHGISLDGIRDLQLMELASRNAKQHKKYLTRFTKCVDHDIPSSNDVRKRWQDTSNVDDYHVFNVLGHAPRSTMKRVEIYPTLYSIYYAKLHLSREAFWLCESRFQLQERVMASQDTKFAVGKKDNALGPAVSYQHELREKAMESWNERIKMERLAGEYELDDDADWVPIQGSTRLAPLQLLFG